MGRGLNLGNCLSAPQEGDWQPPVEEWFFTDLQQAGFQHVRIPVRWDQHTSADAPYMIDPAWLERVAQVVDWALAHELIAIINAHGEHWLMTVCDKADEVFPRPDLEARFHAIWTQVAQKFSAYPKSLVFEVVRIYASR